MELPTVADLIHYAGTLAESRSKLREDPEGPIPNSRMQDDPNILKAIRTSGAIGKLVSHPDANRLLALSKLANGSADAGPLWHLNEGVDRLATCIAVDRHEEMDLHRIYGMSPADFADLADSWRARPTGAPVSAVVYTRIVSKDEAARKLGCPPKYKNTHLWLKRRIAKGPDNGGIHAPIGSGQQWQFVLRDFPIDQRDSLEQKHNTET